MLLRGTKAFEEIAVWHISAREVQYFKHRRFAESMLANAHDPQQCHSVGKREGENISGGET